MWVVILGVCGLGACKGGPKAGSERGACYGNGTCNVGLVCRSKLCVAEGPGEVGVPPGGEPSGARPAVRALPRVTAIVLDYDEGAAVMACAVDGKIVASAWKCSQEMKGDMTVASLGGGTRKLGATKTLKCEPAPGDVQDKQAGFAIDPVPTGRGDDPLREFLVWPTARAADVIRWNAHPSVDLPALTRRAASLAKVLASHTGEDGQPYRMDGPIEVLGTLTADVDGDDQPDMLTSIALPSDEDFWRPNYLLASISSRPGELLDLASTTLEQILPVAAIDLDGDGADEVLVSMPYYEGSYSYVQRVKDGKLETLGGWGCGM